MPFPPLLVALRDLGGLAERTQPLGGSRPIGDRGPFPVGGSMAGVAVTVSDGGGRLVP